MAFNRLQRSIKFLFHHPAFQESPLKTSSRILLWELFKVFHHEPVISIHNRSRMKLTPGPRRGIHGLTYVFRDRMEYPVPASIHRYVKPGDIVFDIGSNIGLWSLLLAEVVGPHGRVESFEPIPNTIKSLKTNIELSGHQNIHVNMIALGSNPGDTTMFLPRDPGRSALAPESEQDTKVTVKLSRLDDFWNETGCPRVKFVKMDVEGAEPQVLRGAHQFITTCRPIFITEVNDSKLRLLNEKKNAIHEILHSYDYNSFIFNDHIRDFEPGQSVENSDYFEVLFAPT
jgi:FkbM family methyltransferase